MPTKRFNKMLGTFAKHQGVSKASAEKRWKEAEDIVDDEYSKTKEPEKYYGTLMKILKNKLHKHKNEAIDPASLAQSLGLTDTEDDKTSQQLQAKKQADVKKIQDQKKKDANTQVRNLQDLLRLKTRMGRMEQDAIKKKINDLKTGKVSVAEDKVEEDSGAAITTTSMGGTAYDSQGNVTTPYVANNAAYVPSYMGIKSRYGDFGKKKSKKKKRKNESTDFIDYVENFIKE